MTLPDWPAVSSLGALTSIWLTSVARFSLQVAFTRLSAVLAAVSVTVPFLSPVTRPFSTAARALEELVQVTVCTASAGSTTARRESVGLPAPRSSASVCPLTG